MKKPDNFVFVMEELGPSRLYDAIGIMVEVVGRNRGCSLLQVRACVESLFSHSDRITSSRRGLATFARANMLGLMEPAVVLGRRRPPPGDPPPASPESLVLLYVGTPVPDNEEREFISTLSKAFEDGTVDTIVAQRGKLRDTSCILLDSMKAPRRPPGTVASENS